MINKLKELLAVADEHPDPIADHRLATAVVECLPELLAVVKCSQSVVATMGDDRVLLWDLRGSLNALNKKVGEG